MKQRCFCLRRFITEHQQEGYETCDGYERNLVAPKHSFWAHDATTHHTNSAAPKEKTKASALRARAVRFPNTLISTGKVTAPTIMRVDTNVAI